MSYPVKLYNAPILVVLVKIPLNNYVNGIMCPQETLQHKIIEEGVQNSYSRFKS